MEYPRSNENVEERNQETKKYIYGNTEVKKDPGGIGYTRTNIDLNQISSIFEGKSLLYSKPMNIMNFKSEPKIKKFNIEYIASASKRKVTFSKRRKGLMKKANELDILTGACVLCIVINENGEASMYSSEKLKLLAENCKKYLLRMNQEPDEFVCFE